MASLYGDLPPPETKRKSNSSNDNDHTNASSSSTTQGKTKISKLYDYSPPVKSTVKTIKKPVIPRKFHFIIYIITF